MLRGQEGKLEDYAVKPVFSSLMGKNQNITFIIDKSSSRIMCIESYSGKIKY